MPKGIPKNGINKSWWKKGQTAWNKNIPLTKEWKENLGKSLKGRISPKGMLGKHHSEKSKQKSREWHINHPNRGQFVKGNHPKTEFKKGSKGFTGKHTEKSNQKNREWHIDNPNKKFRDTSIELKIEVELLRRNINYQKQIPLCKVARVDFYLPEYRIVIQCDGDYYHNLPGYKERDERQNKVLIFNGFNVYRFWEHEINKSPQKCIDKLFIKP